MASLSLALIVVCAVALAVESTRWLGVLPPALLVVLHPKLSLTQRLIKAGAYLYFNHWRDR
jgi:hypothetical protein